MASRQLLEIVNDVLDMSRIESGKLSLEPACVDLESCILEACDLVRTQLEAKKIELSVTCNVSHKWVMCDKVMLDRALMNLLCNAGKFTEENGSVSMKLTELRSSDVTGSYEIRIQDTGIGMSEEFAERLFIPFERERTSTVSKIQGTGLGLEMTAASEPGYYDVILMDIQMPVMDGYMAAKAIRGLPDTRLASIPIIAMTANAFQEDIKKAEEAGLNGHIAKPLDIPAMKATLQHVLSTESRMKVMK